MTHRQNQKRAAHRTLAKGHGKLAVKHAAKSRSPSLPVKTRVAHKKMAVAHAAAAVQHAKAAVTSPGFATSGQTRAAHYTGPRRLAPRAAPAGSESRDPKGGFASGGDDASAEGDYDHESSVDAGDEGGSPEPSDAADDDAGASDDDDNGDSGSSSSPSSDDETAADDDGSDDDSDTTVGEFSELGPDDGSDDDDDANVVGQTGLEQGGPDDGGDDDDDVNIIGAEISDDAIGGFFGDVFRTVKKGISTVAKVNPLAAQVKFGIAVAGGKNIKKSARELAKDVKSGLEKGAALAPGGAKALPFLKTAQGLAFAVPKTGAAVLGATHAAEQLLLAAQGKGTAAARETARRTLAATIAAANKGHPDAKRGLAALQVVKDQVKHLRTLDPKRKATTPGYSGRLVVFTGDKRQTGRQLPGHWARAAAAGNGAVLGTVVVGHGKQAAKLHGWWKKAP